jgi:hypothetical protein
MFLEFLRVSCYAILNVNIFENLFPMNFMMNITMYLVSLK